MIEYKYTPKKMNDKQLSEETGLYHEGNKIINGVMYIVFKKELSQSDKEKLDLAIENHIAVQDEVTQITLQDIMDKLNILVNKMDRNK